MRAFPRIVVVSDADPGSSELARAIAGHLEDGRSVVHQMGSETLERLRVAGRVAQATVAVEVRATLTERESPAVGARERLDCGPAGCMDWRRLDSAPVVRAQVQLRVADGPTGRLLQELSLDEEEAGPDVLAIRLRLLERLGRRVTALLDQRVEEVQVELHPVDHPAVRAALEAAGAGRWDDARRRLEAFVRSSAFRALPVDARAAALHDLGQARRFDASLPAEQRFAAAARALRAAVRLVPHPRFAHAVAALAAHRRSLAMVQVQQEAMAHNFALARRSHTTPAPPASYE